MHVLMLDTL